MPESRPSPEISEPLKSLSGRRALLAQDFVQPGQAVASTDDQIIRPEVTRAYMDKPCRAGSKVSLPGIGHGRFAQASTMEAVDWMTDRFAGKAAPDDCGK